MPHFTMSLETLQLVTLCCAALCSLALLHTARTISSSLRNTSSALLYYAAELTPVEEEEEEEEKDEREEFPSSDLVSPPASPTPPSPTTPDAMDLLLYQEATAAATTTQPEWEAPLSPVLSSSSSSLSPLPEVAVSSLEEELRRAARSESVQPGISPPTRPGSSRPLSYPGVARAAQKEKEGLQACKRTSLIAVPVAPARCVKRDCDGGMKK
ncbi:hypothetical protein ISF_01702 [Cordyceps fumosorosea ARSEF 2679]|uniref:Uncharacterized protein n=1 Tax=Cordyceps fumosorosea (strain ARSEF 2679) TaxID=1081104 RepID=A0A168CAG2_CORFA|nr:hypothetical protein ISF_01702 [Cordyceps fumosorosea ARSEF 2679]OAA71151.1 hypothetical protein ISF_01702 [Cordyceps fumosorosea ARSEF 2679]